jgi:hypothetical protein
MDTVVIQIGNTDDKLSQPEWASFFDQVNRLVEEMTLRVHFAGASDSTRPWQNACWVAEIKTGEATTLERSLEPIRVRFRQDSIAVTYGTTRFIGSIE